MTRSGWPIRALAQVCYSRQEFESAWVDQSADDNEGTLLLLEPVPEFHDAADADPGTKVGFGFLLPYFRPYHRQFVQLMCGLLVASGILLSFPFLTQALVDYGINYNNPNFVHLILAAQLTLFVSQTLVDLLRGWILLHVGSRLNITLIADFLGRLMQLPMAWFDAKLIGDLLQRVQDHDRIESFLSASTLSMLFSIVNFVVFGVVLVIYYPPIFLIFIAGTSLYIAWVLIFMRRRAALDYKRFDQASGNQSSMIQIINGMQEIKLSSSERRRRWEWEAIQIRLYRISIKAMALFQYQSAGGNFINELKNILITFVAAKAVMSGDITLGMMLSIQYIIGQLNAPVAGFVGFMQSWQDARISLDRLAEIHALEPETRPDRPARHTLPEQRDIRIVESLSFCYSGAGNEPVLHNIQLQIPEHKVTAIVGASGSGKTTLLKLLLKFYPPTQGAILVGSDRLEDIDTRFWRRQCGTVMQDGYIFSDSIVRNITESDSDGHIDTERLAQAVRIANLEELIGSLPAGYHTRIGDSGMMFSGGQRQRILIARAVYKNPHYLFFDEATSSLDARNERVIMENLAGFYQGRTVVVIAHRLSTVRHADQILMLENGRIVENGRHEELVKQRGAYYSLVSNQLELSS